MHSLDTNPNRIARWDILKGLPGEGPIPRYFHAGHPTPWAEGFVVRFWDEEGTDWVVNFQGGWWGVASIYDLPESTALIVIAYGACYLLLTADPGQYVCHRHGVTSALVDEEGNQLVLAYQGGALAAYGPDVKQAWIRESIAVDGIKLKSCVHGIITADIEYNYEGSWRSAHIRALDGSDL